MTRADHSRMRHITRRRALAGMAASVPLISTGLSSQIDPRPLGAHRRLPGLDEIVTAFDFEPLMFANVSQTISDYTAHGDGSEFTLRRNREAFDWVDLLPAARPSDPASIDLGTTLLGARLAFPMLIAPTAAQVPLHPDGELGMKRGGYAASATPMILSHNTTTPVEKVAASGPGVLWWQFYPQLDADTGREILARAVGSGCEAVVVTVDQQSSYYERSQHNVNLGGTPRNAARGRGRAGGASAPSGAARYRIATNRLWYTWESLDAIRALLKVPLVVKGILTAEDAAICLQRGVDAIVVSNHGGRSMDYGPSSLEVLPEIVAAVGGRIPVLIDSGFRRGTDILKALALGANAVLLGRTTRWALAAFGEAGVQRVLEILQRELVDAVAAVGRTTMASIDASIVRTRFP